MPLSPTAKNEFDNVCNQLVNLEDASTWTDLVVNYQNAFGEEKFTAAMLLFERFAAYADDKIVSSGLVNAINQSDVLGTLWLFKKKSLTSWFNQVYKTILEKEHAFGLLNLTSMLASDKYKHLVSGPMEYNAILNSHTLPLIISAMLVEFEATDLFNDSEGKRRFLICINHDELPELLSSFGECGWLVGTGTSDAFTTALTASMKLETTLSYLFPKMYQIRDVSDIRQPMRRDHDDEMSYQIDLGAYNREIYLINTDKQRRKDMLAFFSAPNRRTALFSHPEPELVMSASKALLDANLLTDENYQRILSQYPLNRLQIDDSVDVNQFTSSFFKKEILPSSQKKLLGDDDYWCRALFTVFVTAGLQNVLPDAMKKPFGALMFTVFMLSIISNDLGAGKENAPLLPKPL